MKTQIIHQTTDYTIFEKINGNRPLNQKKIAKIITDIEKGFNMLPYVPVIVSEMPNGKLGIIDGQHRRVVSEKTSNPVYYVVCDTLSLKQIAMLNSRGEKWKPQDFLECYIGLGVQHYAVLNDFVLKYQIDIGIARDFLMFNEPKVGYGKNSRELFENGEFVVNFLEEATETIELTLSVFGKYRFYKDRYLIGAVQILRKIGKCDFQRLKEKIKQSGPLMDKQADKKRYLKNIEEVYNYKVQKRDVIF